MSRNQDSLDTPKRESERNRKAKNLIKFQDSYCVQTCQIARRELLSRQAREYVTLQAKKNASSKEKEE